MKIPDGPWKWACESVVGDTLFGRRRSDHGLRDQVQQQQRRNMDTISRRRILADIVDCDRPDERLDLRI